MDFSKPQNKDIVAVHKLHGNIQQVKFNTGEIVSIEDAIKMAEQGLINNVNTGETRNHKKTLRSNPDGDTSNNLDNLPTF